MKLHILAFGAHPDDVELSCSATLFKHKVKGQSIGICDLTKGEMGTRGTEETRQSESEQSSRILQLDAREQLNLRDGFISDDEASKMVVIKVIRKYRPEIVLCNAPKDRHPDHGNAARLVVEAAFLSGLKKIETQQEAWRPKRVLHYIQDLYLKPDFIVDVSQTFDTKMKSIKAFTTQFFNEAKSNEPDTYISGKGFLDSIMARSHLFGKRIGVEHGEGFIINKAWLGLDSLDAIVLPEIS